MDPFPKPSGFLFVDKPPGPTSHDIVDRVRRLSGERTVGHAGTLDPFASGLLIVGVGRAATREFPKLVGLDKRYRAVLRLGAVSETDDLTGRISEQQPAHECRIGDIETALKGFAGKIKQVPPMYSAKKIGGRKLYELARAGKTIERAPVPVEIHSLLIVRFSFPSLTIDVHCSSGTYIRALARDIGRELGCGAYLEKLERLSIGPFSLAEASSLEGLTAENWRKSLKTAVSTLERCQARPAVLG